VSIPSLYAGLRDHAEQLRSELRALMAHSRVTPRFEDAGGGLVKIVTAKPFKWEPLPLEARPRQNHLRESYRQFAALVDAILADQPGSVRKWLQSRHTTFLRTINQDEATTRQTVEENESAALAALEGALRLLAERGSGDREEAILVPDTNALYANPALEAWRFDECARFAIALVPAVVTELDRHKDHHPNDGVRQKAGKLARQIGEYRRRGRLVDGVPLRKDRSRILAWAREPNFETSLPWLDRASADDRLLASALEIARASALAPTAIVTRDLNLQNKCELARIPFLWPPEAEDSPAE
jgi:hypothetical protein